MTRNNSVGRGFSGKALTELLAAVFILLGPTALGGASGGWGLYAVFILTAAVFVLRLAETKRIHISVNIALGGAMLLYALFGLIWASDRYSHIRLIFTIATVILFAMLAGDYFAGEKPGRLGERLSMMVLFSAFICAVWNVAVWGIIRRFSFSSPFDAGLGDSDLLGLYMLIGLWCCLRVFYKNGRFRSEAAVFALPMAFVLIMSRSLLTGLAGGLFIFWFSIKKKLLPLTVAGGIAAAASFALMIIRGFGQLRPFADGLLTGFRHIGGLGGGGFLLRQGELQSVYYSVDRLSLGAELSSSLGLAGLLLFLTAVGWMAYLALTRKSYFCALGSALCIFAFFVPAGESLAGLMLLVGALTYGEWRQGRTISLRLNNWGWPAVIALLAAAAVYGSVLGAADAFKATGARKGDSQTLITASKLNPLDGESCRLAARAYRDSYALSGEKSDITYAQYYIEQAIERCGETAELLTEQAEILADGGDLAGAAELDGRAIELAPLRDDCKVRAATHLYGLIETAQKGSLAAQNYYKRLLELAESVSDIDNKKLINDYADRAQPYTRAELGLEGGKDGEEAEE